MKIILKNKDLYKNLKGFISNKSLNKLIKKEKPFKVNPNKLNKADFLESQFKETVYSYSRMTF